jgi:oligopeptide transport system substrate-binding protein
MEQQQVSRRRFLQLAATAGAATALGACGKVVETVVVTQEVEKVVTQIVQETVIVEGKPKEVTKIVEKAITATPIPAVVTKLGRTLPPDAAPNEKQVYIEAPAENKHLDSARDIYSANSVLNWGTEPMLRRDQDMNLVPAVAESWTAGPAYAYWDFVIRKDCKWSDGTPVTADDWVYTAQHISNPNLDTPWVWFYYTIKGIQDFKGGKITADQIGVEKIDDRTVRVYAQAGGAPEIPALFAYQASHPVPKHIVEKDPAHWADEAAGFVGNGPFRLTEWTHSVREWWEPNEFYNGPHKPGFNNVLGKIGVGGFEAWLAKEVDQLGIDLPGLQRIRSDPKLNPLLRWYNNFDTQYYALDTMNPPLNNLKLRQALAHAIDRDTLCYQVSGGMKSPATTMLMAGFPAYNADELNQYQNYDVEKAKALLAEAGYPEGKDASGKQLELTFTTTGNDPTAQYVQNQWANNLGIKLNIEIVDGSVRGKGIAEHTLQIFGGSYEYDYIDPANLLTMLWQSKDAKGSPRHSWVSPAFDELCNKAAVELDDAKRMQLFKDAEKIMCEDVCAIFMTHSVIYQAWWPYLTGVLADKTGNAPWRWLDLSRFQAYIRDDIDDWRATPTK